MLINLYIMPSWWPWPPWCPIVLLGYSSIDDIYWINLSANLKYRLGTYQLAAIGPMSLYVNGGPGYYFPETGSGGFGANLGAGFDYNYRDRITLEVGVDYHSVIGKEVQFLNSHVGFIYRF